MPRDSDSSEEGIRLWNVEGSANEISFANRSASYCICLIDLVESSKTTAQINDSAKIGSYYSIFLNSVSAVVRKFGGRVVKNVGDGLIFYFPETSDSANRAAFTAGFECLTGMISERNTINERLYASNLPSVSYRLSADYGKVQVAASNSSQREDLFGPTMNIIAKIKPFAMPNSLVIGNDLYRIITSMSLDEQYRFREIGACYLGVKLPYSIYMLHDKSMKKKSVINEAAAALTTRIANSNAGNQLELATIAPPNRVKPELSRRNIMIVDDDEDMLLTFRAFLAGETYHVDTFSDAEAALEHFESREARHYDLCILDIRMPYVNGLQLYQKLKSISSEIKIIIISALDAAEELASIIGLNATDVLKKPVHKEQFIRTVKERVA